METRLVLWEDHGEQKDWVAHFIVARHQGEEQSIENMARGRLIYEPPRYMDIATAAQQLLEIESIRQEQAYTPNTPCVAISRLGSPTQTFKAGTLQELSESTILVSHCTRW